MSKLYRTAGIVMRRREQGDADRVLTLCTPLGKIDVLAKGARKLRSRKAGHIELFTHSSFVLSRVPNYWDIISQAETVEPHATLRDDLLRGAYARYAVELLDRFFTSGEGEQALFDLLNHTLTWLCEDDDLDLAIRFYEQHLLGLAGFRPELRACVGEHADRDRRVLLRPHEPTEEENRPYGFDPERGGALCRDCYTRRNSRHKIASLSPNGLWFLQECQRGPYTRLRAQQTLLSLHEEVERVMQHYITHHLEQRSSASAFLKRLKRMNKAQNQRPL
ncbi:MAG: DNA repair protein RecO [Chloroflexi bacterium]|nr:MAG: DNA repair protein RecO [Chloroflexota bacterium]RLC87117.1 MAG: DNA repair protein RecO [Chloroflexota bacterium]